MPSILLIRRLGMDHINGAIKALGLSDGIRLRRLLFDGEAAARGLESTITAGDMGRYLELAYRGRLFSPAISEKALRILSDQRLGNKMPFFLPSGMHCAHKTGEDSSITHDVGIVWAPESFILCCCANQVCPPRFNRFIQDVTRELLEAQGVPLEP